MTAVRISLALAVTAAGIGVLHHHKPRHAASAQLAPVVPYPSTPKPEVRDLAPARRVPPVARASRGHQRPAILPPVHNWDAVAQCESSGDWHADTGNGYYGGLQFTLSTWHAFGGSGLPSQASRAEQIRIAERVLAVQGWDAWPVCSWKAGVR